MGKLSIRIIVALLTFAIGVALASVWLVRRYNQTKNESKVNIEQQIPADAFIMQARTGCSLGMCPTYKVTVSADGTVVFNALAYWVKEDNYKQSKKAGPIEIRISQAEVNQLISEFERINYFSIKDGCGVRDYKGSQRFSENYHCAKCSTDMPSAITSITINGQSKSIEHYYGCEGTDTLNNLTNLERRIDEILNTKQWMQ
jgi:hypothetical protein